MRRWSVIAIAVSVAVCLGGCGEKDTSQTEEAANAGTATSPDKGKPIHPGVAGSTPVQLDEMRGDREAIAVLVLEYREMYGDTLPVLGELDAATERATDPWGNQYRIVAVESEKGYTIFSNGPDGKPNTEDDLDLGVDVRKPPPPPED